MRRTTILLTAVLGALLPATAADAAKRKRPPPPPPPPPQIFDADGTITVTSVIKTRCAALGGIGTIEETATTEEQYALAGSGSSPAKTGRVDARYRRRVTLEQRVEGTDQVAPRYDRGPWSGGASKSVRFGTVVRLERGQLVVYLRSVTGQTARRATVRPALGETANVPFDCGPRTEDHTEESDKRCSSKTITTTVSGSVDVKRRK